jgi:hypothetical protein
MRIPITKCSTVSCSSNEVEAEKVGKPVEEPGVGLRYPYEGYCPVCRVSLSGFFWVRGTEVTADKKPKN